MLEPGVGKLGGGVLKFVRADVHRAANDAGVSVEIHIGRDVGIVAGVDAGRVGLEMEIATGGVDEERGRW